MGRKVNNEFYVLFTTWLKLLFALSKQQLLFQYISAEFYPSRSGPYSSPCNLHRWNDGQGKHGWPADRLDFWPSASDSMAILCMLLTINRILFHGLYPGHLFYAVFWLLIFQIAFFSYSQKKKKKKESHSKWQNWHQNSGSPLSKPLTFFSNNPLEIMFQKLNRTLVINKDINFILLAFYILLYFHYSYFLQKSSPKQ